MYDKVEICRELAEALREKGNYGRKLNVSFDERLQVWRINYDNEGRQGMIFMEEEEVVRCLRRQDCHLEGLRPYSPW